MTERAKPPAEMAIVALLGQGERAVATILAIQTYDPEMLGLLKYRPHHLKPARAVVARTAEDFWPGLPQVRGQSVRTVAQPTHDALARKSSRLRKRFQLVTRKVRKLAADEPE